MDRITADMLDEKNATIDQLRAALDEACRIALGTELNREAVERIKELRAVGNTGE